MAILTVKFSFTEEAEEVTAIPTQMRQKLLLLYAANPDLYSAVGAWTVYDATGKERHTTGDADTPPYRSVFAAMQDGWRVIQIPQQFPAYPGTELTTAYLRFEYVLEKLEEVETDA